MKGVVASSPPRVSQRQALSPAPAVRNTAAGEETRQNGASSARPPEKRKLELARTHSILASTDRLPGRVMMLSAINRTEPSIIKTCTPPVVPTAGADQGGSVGIALAAVVGTIRER